MNVNMNSFLRNVDNPAHHIDPSTDSKVFFLIRVGNITSLNRIEFLRGGRHGNLETEVKCKEIVGIGREG